MTRSGGDDDEAVELPIDGVLDLHTFAPSDVKDLVAGYIDECAERGIFEVRLIHGVAFGCEVVVDRAPRRSS